MKAFTYIKKGEFAFVEKAKPTIKDAKDAIVRVTMSSICTSDLHIKHGSVPRAVPGITVGHEMVGVVEEVGGQVTHVKPGDRVTVNVETYCGECFYCQHGYVNNCTSPHGGWALGCRIDGGQTEYVRVPYATTGLNKIPDTVSDEQALFVGDILATGFWATRISEIKEEDTVLIIGAGPTGVCCLLCTLLKNPGKIIVCEKSEARRAFIQEHYPQVLVVEPEDCETFVKEQGLHGGADVVMEVAGGSDTFQLAWKCARPNAIVTIVAMYDKPQMLPLPDMYGKNLIFKTGGVDGCDCEEILSLIAQGKIDGVGIARQFLSDPEWITKLMEGREEDIRPCICCHNACFNMAHYNGVGNDQTLADNAGMARCALNPETMQSSKYKIVKTGRPKNIAVIGGGIGGMEAARVLTLRGHKVTIYEKADRLGGVFIAAAAPEFKEKDRELIKWYEKEMKDLGIDIKFNTEVKDTTSLNADEVIVATGSKARILKVPGAEKAIEACDYLLGRKEVGQKVIIIGGGLTGCEIALDMYRKGKTPVIVEMKNDLIAVKGVCLANSSYLRDFFALNNVEVHLDTMLSEVTDKGVIVKAKDGSTFEIEGDTVLISAGYIPTPAFPQDKHVHLVGDCNGVGNLRTVIWRAWDVAMAL